MPPLVHSLDHIQLAMPAGREPDAEGFYSGVLGFERVPKPAHLEARGGCWFQSGAVQLHLGVEPGFAPARKAHPGLVVRDLAEVQARLEAAGHEVKWDTQISGFERFYSSDPFGNRLEFLQPA